MADTVACCDIDLSSVLSAEQAEAIFAQGKDAVVFALLELSKRAAEGAADEVTPSTPSAMIPPYQKPSGKQPKKKAGAKKGHPGSSRKVPERIDWQQTDRAESCPDCGSQLNRCSETRVRYVEDIPEVTEHTIHRDWCPKCRKKVEPPITDALPGSQIGLRVVVLSAWLHYSLGNTVSQIVDVSGYHMQMKLTAGGLVQMWYRLQEILFAWYEQIHQESLQSAVLHADETGWRNDGRTNWLWCFASTTATFDMIDRSRGSPALEKFFTAEFEGTLVTDF